MAFAHAHRATFAGTLVLVVALIPLTLGKPATSGIDWDSACKKRR